MGKFYFYLWRNWVIRITLCSIFLASFFSFIFTFGIVLTYKTFSFDKEMLQAIFDIWFFWLHIFWNIAFLIALFRSIKYIFAKKYNAFMLELYDCKDGSIIDNPGYGDLVSVWRKWFTLLMWFVGIEMIFSTFFLYLFQIENLFLWFNIYTLYFYTIVAGYIALSILPNRVKNVKVKRC